MATYKFLALTNSVEGRDDEFNEWYDSTHVPDVLKVPGFVGAQRFALTDVQRMDPPPSWRYLAIYEIETDDLEHTIKTLGSLVGTPAISMSDALEPKPTSLVFEAIGPFVQAETDG